MDLQDSVQRSLHNSAETILQICTDSQRSKTWVGESNRFIRKAQVNKRDGVLRQSERLQGKCKN